MSYKNVVGKSIGIVFVNSSTLNLKYPQSKITKSVQNATNQMRNVWKVDDLKIFRDQTKEEVVK